MNVIPDSKTHTRKRGTLMDLLLPLGFLAAWFVLQAWVLPKFGIET